MTKLEEAMIAAAQAVDARELKIVLFRLPGVSGSLLNIDVNRIGSAALTQIHEMTDGIPLFGFDPEHPTKDPKAPYRNHAQNLQLLLDIYKAWIEEGPLK